MLKTDTKHPNSDNLNASHDEKRNIPVFQTLYGANKHIRELGKEKRAMFEHIEFLKRDNANLERRLRQAKRNDYGGDYAGLLNLFNVLKEEKSRLISRNTNLSNRNNKLLDELAVFKNA